jgi:hypothetical protein
MARKRVQHVTEATAARIAGRYGWSNKTNDEARNIAAQPAIWRLQDAGNVARIATALEQIARHMKKRNEIDEEVKSIRALVEEINQNYQER